MYGSDAVLGLALVWLLAAMAAGLLQTLRRSSPGRAGVKGIVIFLLGTLLLIAVLIALLIF